MILSYSKQSYTPYIELYYQIEGKKEAQLSRKTHFERRDDSPTPYRQPLKTGIIGVEGGDDSLTACFSRARTQEIFEKNEYLHICPVYVFFEKLHARPRTRGRLSGCRLGVQPAFLAKVEAVGRVSGCRLGVHPAF